jgi:C-terminal processing protease CtpA/Prc
VLRFVAQIPGLRSLAIVDGVVDDEALKPLTRIERLESLDFRYAKLSDRQIDLLAAIPIRESLNLMGTGISVAKAEELQQQFPRLQIAHRKGAFLGVTCRDFLDRCEINTIVPNGAAEAAGLLPNDVIVQIGDAEIHRFRDLQVAINELNQGDEVQVRYRRGGGEQIHRVKVRLKRLEEK